jgi:hypothetical protein
MKKTASGGIESGPEAAKANGLMLKVVVMRVSLEAEPRSCFDGHTDAFVG